MIVMLLAAVERGLPTLSCAWTAAHSQGADQRWESFLPAAWAKASRLVACLESLQTTFGSSSLLFWLNYLTAISFPLETKVGRQLRK